MAVSTELALSAEQHATFAALADVLIPAAGKMPSASEADREGKWLGKALDARPDLLPELERVLDAAAGRDPEQEVHRLYDEEPDGFKALATFASGSYYMNIKVRKRIGFPGQGKRPPFPDEAEYDLRDGLLDPVIERGPIHKQAPRSLAPSDGPTPRWRSRARRSRPSCTTRSAARRSTSAPSGCACGRRTSGCARWTGSPTTGRSPTRR